MAVHLPGTPHAARRIVTSHGAPLGEYAIIAARKVGLLPAPFTLVLTGGVLRHPSPVLRNALVARVCEGEPDVRLIQSRLEQTLPGTGFFAT